MLITSMFIIMSYNFMLSYYCVGPSLRPNFTPIIYVHIKVSQCDTYLKLCTRGMRMQGSRPVGLPESAVMLD